MKIGLMLILLTLSQIAVAQSLKEKKDKLDIMNRVDALIVAINEGRVSLEKEDVVPACKKINDIFKILPDHLLSIGTRMNLFDSKVIKMENETKMFLIYIHQRSNICSNGETGENLDISETKQKFKSMKRMLEKQKKIIKKLDTDYENTYNYYYEFN
jgi:hypothetical protein